MIFKTYHKTVAVLVDDLPSFDRTEAERLLDFLNSNGYNSLAVSCKDVKNGANLRKGVQTLIIPQCESTPAELMEPIRNYVGRGGNLLCLGGPMFYDNIVLKDGRYVIEKMPEEYLDVTFLPGNSSFVLEGIAPSYKVFKTAAESYSPADSLGAVDFMKSDSRDELICPIPRNHGAGHFERRERFIPLMYGDDTTNAAAFFMLSSEAFGGHDAVVPRPGYVMPTTLCQAYGGIGIKRADILSVKGADKLILSMLARFSRGLWLFEAGINSFRPNHGERVKLGGSVMNSSLDYKSVEVEFRVGDEIKHTERLTASPRRITSFEYEYEIDSLFKADCELTCTLKSGGEPIDEISQEIVFRQPVIAADSEFVKVRDGHFELDGKPWQMVGMNYWPSYYPSFEVVNYWRGWLDSATYDPKIVELDLSRMEKLGINCLLTRLDTLDIKSMKSPLRDFIERMRVHKMKLGLAVPFIEAPTNYQPEAFRELINENELANEPVLFAHDVTWEVSLHLMTGFRDNYTDEWNEWVKNSYGSIEAAASEWGYLPELKDGVLQVPAESCFKTDGEHRICTAAFRRFADGLYGRIWLDAIGDMRSVAPKQLYTYRQGPTGMLDCTYSATHTATDFVCPEGYHIKGTEDGYANACFSTEFLRTLSANQPVVWAEYGKSLCGLRWTKLHWDHDGFGFYDDSLTEMSNYLSIFHRMLLATHSDGSAPWWWCGGFRRTEMSDFGYCSPAGELRPCAIEYKETAEKLMKSERRTPTRCITVDRDADARGNQHICNTIGTLEWQKAEADGEYLGIKLDGEGVDTASLPKIAVGNVPFTGKNPHKYLDSLFKSATVEGNKLRVEFFNTNVATWLASNTYVKIDVNGESRLFPIGADTKRLKVASALVDLAPGDRAVISMYTDAAGEFGERYETAIK